MCYPKLESVGLSKDRHPNRDLLQHSPAAERRDYCELTGGSLMPERRIVTRVSPPTNPETGKTVSQAGAVSRFLAALPVIY